MKAAALAALIASSSDLSNIKVYEEIRDKHEIILRLFIKYVLTSKKDILLHILLETNEAVRKEKLILSDLINDIIIRYEHL